MPVGHVTGPVSRGRYRQRLIAAVTAVRGIGQQVVNAGPADVRFVGGGGGVVVVVTEQQVLRAMRALLCARPFDVVPPRRDVRSVTAGRRRRRFVRRSDGSFIVAVGPQKAQVIVSRRRLSGGRCRRLSRLAAGVAVQSAREKPFLNYRINGKCGTDVFRFNFGDLTADLR